MKLMRLVSAELAKRSVRFLVMTMSAVMILPLVLMAQEGGMVSWKFSAKKISADVSEFSAKATVASGWHIYAQDSGEGSMPTVFTFTANPLVKLEGQVVEQGKVVTKRNEVMDSELKYYEDSVVFVQKVKILKISPAGRNDTGMNPAPAVLKGKVEFMACNDQMCLPPEEVEFAVELK